MASKRIEQLDGIRALAICAVLAHHLFGVRLLWMGVDLFFILSGFLITGVLLDRRNLGLRQYFGHFYQRRARRILPPYLLLLCITSALFGLSWLRHWYLYLFLTNVVVAAGLAQPMALTVLWSLGVEEQFYFVWPFAVAFLSEQAIAWTAGGLMLAAPLLRWLCTPLFAQHWAIYCLTPFRMDTLATGALLAIIWRQRRDVVLRFGHYGPIFSAFALGALALLARNPGFTISANTRESNLLIYELTLAITAGILLWALSGKGIGVLTLAPVRYLGKISYSVYLFHLVIFTFMSRYLHGRTEVLLATLVITIAYSSASWAFLERPLLARRSAKPHQILKSSR